MPNLTHNVRLVFRRLRITKNARAATCVLDRANGEQIWPDFKVFPKMLGAKPVMAHPDVLDIQKYPCMPSQRPYPRVGLSIILDLQACLINRS